jgi:hypothetical protein
MQKKLQADYIGMLAGSMCLIHCLATPFLFIAKACVNPSCCDAPLWWRFVDFMFIIVSFVAIFYATQNSTKQWVVVALWVSWAVLLAVILNEAYEVIHLPEVFVYVPALVIVVLHFYNNRYCKCSEQGCCLEE